MGKRIARCCLILAVTVGLSGCVSYTKEEDKVRIHSLGIAEVEECTYYEGREDGMVKECSKVETDAFSGWEALMTGIGKMVVRIMTFGIMGK